MMKIACQGEREWERERESFADDEKVLCVYCGASAKDGKGGREVIKNFCAKMLKPLRKWLWRVRKLKVWVGKSKYVCA